ncbi:hypothetical protein HYR69_09415 [Candidatus Sumerlaeota bacterium]|nr:hypothetical protein [Candidatus Sumerlaeota bacterium]
MISLGIADSSSFISLGKIGRLELLRRAFTRKARNEKRAHQERMKCPQQLQD